jgi:hypothetical protein
VSCSGLAFLAQRCNNATDYPELAQHTNEVKRMLAGLILKLTADS